MLPEPKPVPGPTSIAQPRPAPGPAAPPPPAAVAPEPPAPAGDREQAIRDDPLVKKAIEVFGGRVVHVEPRKKEQ